MNASRAIVALIFIASTVLWYCINTRSEAEQTSGDCLTVVCTTGMIADMVRAVGGTQVRVICLMGPGIDPHLYRACEGDVRRLAGADIIFYNGLHLEGKMSHLFSQMSRYAPTYALADALPRDTLRSPVDFAENFDPHLWLDVSLWACLVPFVRDILIVHDPAHAPEYEQRAAAYHAQLMHLDAYVRNRAATVPESQRILVTAHDAFNYFGAAYGFQVIGLQGISTESEAGVRDISNLVDFLCAHRVPAIFVESSISQRALQAVQCATHARGWQVAIGPELFSDALGNPGTPEATYIGMVTHNIDAIVDALRQ